MNVERRYSAETIRADRTDGTPSISGYAAVFNADYVMYEDDNYRVIERIAPGAFDSVMNDDVRCLFNHDPDNVLGRTANGTLDMAADTHGLKFRAKLNTSTHIANDVREMVKRGDVSGCSFAFTVAEQDFPDQSPDADGREVLLRVITKIGALYDVGPVTYPAYEQTSVQARNELPVEIRNRMGASHVVDREVEERERITSELLAEVLS